MSARFTIRRHSPHTLTAHPWVMRDAERPSFVGQYTRHDLAVAAMDATVRRERGLAPVLDVQTDDILVAMQRRREERAALEREAHPAYRHTMSPCIVEPIIVDENEPTA